MMSRHATVEQIEEMIERVTRLGEGIQASNEAIATSNVALEESNQSIAALRDYGRHSRDLIRWLWGAIALGILSMFGVLFVGVIAWQAGNDARGAAKANCEAANAGRAATVALWDHALTLAQPTTPEAEVVRTQFIAYVHEQFPQRVC